MKKLTLKKNSSLETRSNSGVEDEPNFWTPGAYSQALKRLENTLEITQDVQTMLDELVDFEARAAKFYVDFAAKWKKHFSTGRKIYETRVVLYGTSKDVLKKSVDLMDIFGKVHLENWAQIQSRCLLPLKNFNEYYINNNYLNKTVKSIRDDFQTAQTPYVELFHNFKKARQIFFSYCLSLKPDFNVNQMSVVGFNSKNTPNTDNSQNPAINSQNSISTQNIQNPASNSQNLQNVQNPAISSENLKNSKNSQTFHNPAMSAQTHQNTASDSSNSKNAPNTQISKNLKNNENFQSSHNSINFQQINDFLNEFFKDIDPRKNEKRLSYQKRFQEWNKQLEIMIPHYKTKMKEAFNKCDEIEDKKLEVIKKSLTGLFEVFSGKYNERHVDFVKSFENVLQGYDAKSDLENWAKNLGPKADYDFYQSIHTVENKVEIKNDKKRHIRAISTAEECIPEEVKENVNKRPDSTSQIVPNESVNQ